MKRYIKNILGLLLCIGLLQPTVQANPFWQASSKWAARGAAVWYWSILAMPGLSAAGLTSVRETVRQEVHKVDKQGNPIFPDLKSHDPEKYAQTNAILQREGLTSLDDYSIKVLTDAALEKEPLLKVLLDSPSSFGKKVIILPDAMSAEGTKNKSALSNLDSTTLAALLGHEMEHDKQDHGLKHAALRAATPFLLHALAQRLVVSTPSQGAYPTITRSVGRMALAWAIMMGSELLGNYWYSRQSEREADAALRESPALAIAMASFVNDDYERNWEADWIEHWNAVRSENKSTGLIDSVLARTLNQSDYIQANKNYEILGHSHPWPSERIAYLKKWAAEANSKQEQNK